MGYQGYRALLGVVDEIDYFQPELPIAEASLVEHKRLTGHLDQECTINPTTWVCNHYDKENGNCMASWPPPPPMQERMEAAMLAILRTGKHTCKVGDSTFEIRVA